MPGQAPEMVCAAERTVIMRMFPHSIRTAQEDDILGGIIEEMTREYLYTPAQDADPQQLEGIRNMARANRTTPVY